MKMNSQTEESRPGYLDVVELVADVPADAANGSERGLKKGEHGTVVEIYPEKDGRPGGFMVEFSDENGVATVIAALSASQLNVIWRLHGINPIK